VRLPERLDGTRWSKTFELEPITEWTIQSVGRRVVFVMLLPFTLAVDVAFFPISIMWYEWFQDGLW